MKRNCRKFISGVVLTGVLLFASCHSTQHATKVNYEVSRVAGSMKSINAEWDVNPDEDAIAILQPYKKKVDEMMYEVIGISEMKMDKGGPESLLSNLVAEVLQKSATPLLGKPADMGLVNVGGLRNILPKGNITVGMVFEILPFENSLCVMTLKGVDLKRLLTAIARRKGEGVSGVRMEITKEGKLLHATVGGKQIEDTALYTVATIDYLADGNGGMSAFLQAEKRECPEGATLRGLFLDYVRQQTASGKTITSKLDGRITIK